MSYSPRVSLYSHAHLDKVSRAIFKLDTWFESLPHHLRVMPQTVSAPAAVIVLNTYFHFVVMLLYRPYYYTEPKIEAEKERNLGIHRCSSAA
jgi:hypothetical protein